MVRAERTRRVVVLTFIPSQTGVEQAATRLFAPSTSTTQTRQAPRASWVSMLQRVGITTPAFFEASRMVDPGSTVTSTQSTETLYIHRLLGCRLTSTLSIFTPQTACGLLHGDRFVPGEFNLLEGIASPMYLHQPYWFTPGIYRFLAGIKYHIDLTINPPKGIVFSG
jgi:hypothetical protein